MRVLHILNHGLPTQDGYVYRTKGILDGQRAQGFDTFHLTSPRHEFPINGPEETVEGLSFFRTKRQSSSRLPLFRELMEMRATAKRVGDVVKRVQPNVIQAHSPLLNGFPALWTARKYGLPIVYEIRAFWEDAAVDQGQVRQDGPRYRATRRLETNLCQSVDAVTTICEGLRDNLIERGIAKDKITVIPNAVKTRAFNGLAAPDLALTRMLGLEGCKVLGFIGSFYTYEGLALMIDAMPALLEKDPTIRLILIGGGQDDATLKRRAEIRGLDGKILFTGRVPHDQIADYYSLIDICVYPRLPMALTDLVTPLKPLEAMAAGRVVVASDVGGHRELITDNETGYLFRAGYLTALIERIQDALASKEHWAQIRANGQAMVSARNWQTVTAAYRPLFERLCREPLDA